MEVPDWVFLLLLVWLFAMAFLLGGSLCYTVLLLTTNNIRNNNNNNNSNLNNTIARRVVPQQQQQLRRRRQQQQQQPTLLAQEEEGGHQEEVAGRHDTERGGGTRFWDFGPRLVSRIADSLLSTGAVMTPFWDGDIIPFRSFVRSWLLYEVALAPVALMILWLLRLPEEEVGHKTSRTFLLLCATSCCELFFLALTKIKHKTNNNNNNNNTRRDNNNNNNNNVTASDPPELPSPPPQPPTMRTRTTKCVVCQEMEAVRAVVPCGHMCLCDEGCADALVFDSVFDDEDDSSTDNYPACPICRGYVGCTLKIYTT